MKRRGGEEEKRRGGEEERRRGGEEERRRRGEEERRKGGEEERRRGGDYIEIRKEEEKGEDWEKWFLAMRILEIAAVGEGGWKRRGG